MKKFFQLLLTCSMLLSCKTQDIPDLSHPQMRRLDLQNTIVKPGQPFFLDIDGNGSTDYFFNTQLVGDPILQRDRLQYMAHSAIGTNLLNNDHDQSPVLNTGEKIVFKHDSYEWYELSAIMLAEKIISMTEPVHWEGRWRNASHKFLPVQVKKNGHFFHGWIELSFDTIEEKIILHNAAVSLEEGKEVRAGF